MSQIMTTRHARLIREGINAVRLSVYVTQGYRDKAYFPQEMQTRPGLTQRAAWRTVDRFNHVPRARKARVETLPLPPVPPTTFTHRNIVTIINNPKDRS
jgi:hypothetical protein